MVQAELMVTSSSVTHSYFTLNHTMLYSNPPPPTPANSFHRLRDIQHNVQGTIQRQI